MEHGSSEVIAEPGDGQADAQPERNVTRADLATRATEQMGMGRFPVQADGDRGPGPGLGFDLRR